MSRGCDHRPAPHRQRHATDTGWRLHAHAARPDDGAGARRLAARRMPVSAPSPAWRGEMPPAPRKPRKVKLTPRAAAGEQQGQGGMARIRSIHPGLFTDEAFMALSLLARVVLPGLWTECDDQGVFPGRRRR